MMLPRKVFFISLTLIVYSLGEALLLTPFHPPTEAPRKASIHSSIIDRSIMPSIRIAFPTLHAAEIPNTRTAQTQVQTQPLQSAQAQPPILSKETLSSPEERFAYTSEIKRGDRLTSQTRMGGNVMVDYTLNVLSVVTHQRPDTDAILAVIEDDLFYQTGVLAGMSGSPVYFEGRLIGAVAYTVPFLKKPIVGITPITAMLRINDYYDVHTRTSLQRDSHLDPQHQPPHNNNASSPSAPLPNLTPTTAPTLYTQHPLPQDLLLTLILGPRPLHLPTTQQKQPSPIVVPPRQTPNPVQTSSSTPLGPLVPIATPLAISGNLHLTEKDFLQWSGLPHSILTVAGSGSHSNGRAAFDTDTENTAQTLAGPDTKHHKSYSLTNQGNNTRTALAETNETQTSAQTQTQILSPQTFDELIPGDLIGVNLVRGSLNISAFGTVTHVEGDTLLAFGHPMQLLGQTDLSLYTGFVDAVVPRLDFSYKVGRLLNEVGSIREDRQPGILGVRGKNTPRLPISVTLKTPLGPTNLHFEVIRTRPFMEAFAGLVLANSFVQFESIGERRALQYTLDLTTTSGETLSVKRNLRYAPVSQNLFSVIGYLRSVLSVILDNPYTPTDLANISLMIESSEDDRFATLSQVDYPKRPIQAGVPFTFTTTFDNFQGGRSAQSFSFTPPATLANGTYTVALANAQVFLTEDLQRNPSRYASHDLKSLLHTMSLTPKEDELVIWLTPSSAGAIGTSLKQPNHDPYPNLPGIKRNLLTALPQTGQTFIENVAHQREPMSLPVLGKLQFPITIEN